MGCSGRIGPPKYGLNYLSDTYNYIYLKYRLYACLRSGEMKVKLSILPVLLFSIMLSSTFGWAAINFQTENYLDTITRMKGSYEHVLDDLCGMMDLALKFKDDPDYNYDPSDMERIVMRDGVNGTEELIGIYNELLNTTLNDVKSLQKEFNYTIDLDEAER